MTRQIKVRVWNGIEMVYDVVVGRFGAFYVNPGAKGDGLNEKDTASLTPFNTIYSKETPVMEFTGLLDKTGKEIYEGDLLKAIPNGMEPRSILEVFWDETMASFYVRIKNKIDGTIVWDDMLEGFTKEYEIIGNIYRNPELLK